MSHSRSQDNDVTQTLERIPEVGHNSPQPPIELKFGGFLKLSFMDHHDIVILLICTEMSAALSKKIKRFQTENCTVFPMVVLVSQTRRDGDDRHLRVPNGIIR